jgi:hypothetical protein
MSLDETGNDIAARMAQAPLIQSLLAELKAGLHLYWEAADGILRKSGVTLTVPDQTTLSLPNNFFSLLFLYSYRQAGISRSRRILYAATLQCLRGMVTGCDNLLDDEYKPTLETDIPDAGHRFRSVVDIMVSDRVLFQVLMEAVSREELTMNQVLAASRASMQTMIRSGIQEAAEEAGISTILEPAAIIESIHHFKTGILFQCPWDIPSVIETVDQSRLTPLLQALYRIGMGCQIMDDMVDMAADVDKRRHNYLVSLIRHGANAIERDRLAEIMQARCQAGAVSMLAGRFPEAFRQAFETSLKYLKRGFEALFPSNQQALVKPSIRFLEMRLGVHQLIRGAAP